MNTQTEKRLTKAERRKQQLERHYLSLEKLAFICGVLAPNGRKLSSKLLALEHTAHKLATDYCNGENGITTENWSDKIEPIEKDVQKLFNNQLQGFFVNGDARGYALKIKDGYFRNDAIYSTTGLHQDWGGYGILAPEITGN